MGDMSARVLRRGPKNVEWQNVGLTVHGVRGVAGVAALPLVEEGHNMLQDR